MSSDLEYRVKMLEEEIRRLNERLNALEVKIEVLIQTNNHLSTLIKYVVTPLIIILGALIGVKITVP
jgi:prefoldin subunit 5